MTRSMPKHPRTGLAALGFRKDGRAIFPVLGADQNGDEAVARQLAEIDSEIARVRSSLIEFADAAEPTEDAEREQHSQRFAGLETELTTLEARREPIAHRAAVIGRVREAVAASSRSTESGNAHRGPQIRERVQPFANLGEVASRSLDVGELQSRALAAIEQVDEHVITDEQRERAEQLIRTNDRHGRIARHMLLTGSGEYSRAFDAVLTGSNPWDLSDAERSAMAFASAHNRAINEGSAGAGGLLVPFYLDPTVILTSAGSTNPIRQIARVESISTNKWHGVTSAGVTAHYRGEAEETTDDSPSFASPEVDVVKADAYLQASFEAMQDTNVVASFGMLLADAKDAFESHEMLVGDGAAGHMQGVMTGVAGTPGSLVKTGTVGTFTIADVWALRNGIKPRYRRNAKWLGEQATYDLIRQFATGSGQQSGSFWVDLGGDTPASLIGKPVYEASDMDSTVATGKNVLAYGDFKAGYLVVDRIGMSVQYNPLVIGPNRRPTGEAGWYAYWRVGAGVIVPDAIRALQVK